jgi:hypothetical protein
MDFFAAKRLLLDEAEQLAVRLEKEEAALNGDAELAESSGEESADSDQDAPYWGETPRRDDLDELSDWSSDEEAAQMAHLAHQSSASKPGGGWSVQRVASAAMARSAMLPWRAATARHSSLTVRDRAVRTRRRTYSFTLPRERACTQSDWKMNECTRSWMYLGGT